MIITTTINYLIFINLCSIICILCWHYIISNCSTFWLIWLFKWKELWEDFKNWDPSPDEKRTPKEIISPLTIKRFIVSESKKSIIYFRSLGIKWIAFIGSFCCFILSLYLLRDFYKINNFGNNVISNLDDYGHIISNNNSFFLFSDGVSIFFIILTTFIIMLCIIVSRYNIVNNHIYYICLLTLNLLLILAFSTWHLLWFYIFFEAILIPMFIMIILWGSRERKIKAGFYFFLYTVVGSFSMLIGILLLYLQTQTLDINQLAHYAFDLEKQKILWLCFFIGFSIKIPTIPFHLWLPEAHVEAPTTGSVILASSLLKLGGYGFLRISLPLFPLATKYFLPLIYTLCILSIIYASIIALRQVDIKKIIAYTSIAHMNLIVLGIFSLTVYGLTGAIFLMIAHGIVSGALFLIIGVLYERFHTRLLNYYGGLGHFMPLFATFFCIFSLGNLGFPGTCNFIGEFLVLLAILHGNLWVAILSATTMICSAAYSLWLFNRVCMGTFISLKHFLIICVVLKSDNTN